MCKHGLTNADSSFGINVVEMSGCSHRLDGLQPSLPLYELLAMVGNVVRPGEVKFGFGLIVEDRLLTSNDGGQIIGKLGFADGVMITVVAIDQTELWESTALVGDEEPSGVHHDTESSVRLALLDHVTCILVRRTLIRALIFGVFRAEVFWDVCRGTYTLQADQLTCEWHQKYRRVRKSSDNGGHNRHNDSGWLRFQDIPGTWSAIDLSSGSWQKKGAKLIDGDRILGTPITGRGSAAEALQILALDDHE